MMNVLGNYFKLMIMNVLRVLFLASFIFSSCFTVRAQWQTTNNYDYFFTGRYLGIGTNQPFTFLSVHNDSSYISYNQATIIADFRRVYQNSHATFNIYGYPDTEDLPDFLRGSIMLYSTNDAKNFKICAAPDGGTIQFITDDWADPNSERMRIDGLGNVGIATRDPKSRLHIADGDVYISDINKGVIMKSPDGNCWRGILDNSGTLLFTQVECPENSTVSVPTPQGNNEKVKVYPNPVTNVVTIILDETFHKTSFYLLNSAGQIVHQGKLHKALNEIKISELDSGIYLLKVINSSGNIIYNDKLIKI